MKLFLRVQSSHGRMSGSLSRCLYETKTSIFNDEYTGMPLTSRRAMHIRKCGISLCCCTLLSSTKLALPSLLNACYSQEYSAPSTLPLSVRNVFLYHWSHPYSISLQFAAGKILSLALLNSFSFLSAIPF